MEERYKQVNQQLYALNQYGAQQNAEFVRTQSEYNTLLTQHADVANQLRLAQQMNRLERLFRGIHQDALEKELSEVNYQIWSTQGTQAKIQRDLELAYTHRATLEAQIKQLRDRFQYIMSQINAPSRNAPRIARLQEEVANLEYMFAQDDALQQAEEHCRMRKATRTI